MKSLFRRLEIQATRREVMVKESLTTQLMSCIKDVQLEHAHNKHEKLKSDECTSSLCTVLEAVFIHGLKETLVDRVSFAIASPDQRPEPEFWSPLMVFSHRDIIKEILKMSQITTDIGRCRAWIRLALNDGLLISYLETILRENKALNPYYKKSAYLRDPETLLVAKNSLEGISSISFQLPTNSSLLNVWSNTPLLLAGLWTVPMKSCPVSMGMDVAKTLSVGETREQDRESLLSFQGSLQDTLPGFGRFAVSEEEALKIILGTPIEGSPLQSASSGDQGPSLPPHTTEPQPAESRGPNLVEQDSSKVTSGFEVPSDPLPLTEGPPKSLPGVEAPPSQLPSEPKKEEIPLPPQSFQSLLKDYTPSSASLKKPPNLQDFLQRYQAPLVTSPTNSSGSDEGVLKMDYEVINEESFSIKAPEFRSMVEHLSRIMQEPGLDSQNYSCMSCGQPIGISIMKARLCWLTGWYFCEECFGCEDWVVPARIILNWDFGRYEVSSKAANFLNEVQHHPLIDVRRINPKLYLAIEDMAFIQKLRLQLNLLRGYLQTCREPILKKLQKQVWPREYLYEHVHLYSISDLVEIPNGGLGQFLQKMIKFSQDHVLSCFLCSQKGFVCEICKGEKAIYPFDLDISFRCLLCKGVFHIECKKKLDYCPKCERIKKRQMELDNSDTL